MKAVEWYVILYRNQCYPNQYKVTITRYKSSYSPGLVNIWQSAGQDFEAAKVLTGEVLQYLMGNSDYPLEREFQSTQSQVDTFIAENSYLVNLLPTLMGFRGIKSVGKLEDILELEPGSLAPYLNPEIPVTEVDDSVVGKLETFFNQEVLGASNLYH